MTLYNESNNFKPWQGESVYNTRYPYSIEQSWNYNDLREVGLWRDDMIEEADPVPEGKIVVSRSVQSVDGVVKWINQTEDAPVQIVVIPEMITSRQFKLRLLSMGILDDVETWVSAQTREIQIAYTETSIFTRDDSMLSLGFTDLGFTPEEVDTFFIEASEI